MSAQELEDKTHYSNFIIPEFLYGKTAEPNDSFPPINAQKGLFISFGKDHRFNLQEWAYRLNYPKTGISIGVTDLGNSEFVGYNFSVEPFMEVDFLKKTIKGLKLHAGMGAAYFTEKFDAKNNPNNRGVTTDVTWSFKLFFYYELLKQNRITYRLGAGYRHQSNGHTRLPNQGFNSFLVSASAQFDYKKERAIDSMLENPFSKKEDYFLAIRSGIGQQAFATAFNTRKEVFSVAISGGKTYNKTLKLGGGFYYRVYEHYYDYIKNNESLVQDGREFDDFKDKPWHSASTLGVFGQAELILNHVGIDVQVGFNIYKPAYAIDWRLNEGWMIVPRDIPEDSPIVLGEFNTKYKLKKYISSRLGLNYYFIGTDQSPKHNFFIGAHINGNLGQADFTELSVGYVRSFGISEK